jgi:hypothetical protein
MVNRGCSHPMPDGRLCAAPAMRGEQYCYVHEPGKAEEAQEARRLGGLRRRRERTVAVAHGLNGVRTIEDLLRVVEIAILDTLGLPNDLARNRVLLAGAATGAKLIEVGDHETRLQALEALLQHPAPDTGDI